MLRTLIVPLDGSEHAERARRTPSASLRPPVADWFSSGWATTRRSARSRRIWPQS
jgi:hypothetical protein